MSLNQATETIRADDYVEYYLFPDLSTVNGFQDNEEHFLRAFMDKINDSIKEHVKNYIWHKDPFLLIPRWGNSNLLNEEQSENDDDLLPHLHGLTFYGENIEDEWFIVDLLFKLTKMHKGLIARVIDSDGEFMLIEAANVLPPWANPDTCQQRVYIYDGEVHLVQNSPSNTTSLISVSAAIDRIRNHAHLYRVPAAIATCIQTRISNFKQDERSHKATVYIPASAAIILNESPAIIAATVRAFFHRDQIDMKACRAMKHFPPETRIYSEVVFTRCLYAMLSHTKYNPDRRTGWRLPAPSDEKFKAHDLGMKIACGLEILASKGGPEANEIENDKAWHLFLGRLKEKGYFGENIENSKGYTEKLQSAKEYYKIFADSRPTYVTNIAQDIISKLNNIDASLNSLNIDELQTYNPKDDNEDWLNISAEDLDQMLAERYGITKSFSTDADDASAETANSFTKNIKSFLEQKSDIDGVDVRPEPPKRGIKKNSNQAKKPDSTKVRFEEPENDKANNNNIDFNPEAFQQHLKDMLDMVIPEDNWDSQSDMSDFDDDLIDKNIEEMAKAPQGSIDAAISSYMEQMDRELAATTIGKSFNTKKENKDDEDDFDDIESFEPVNIDVNALQNLAESYQAQLGGHGPAASLLGSLGIRIDPTQKKDKSEQLNGPS